MLFVNKGEEVPRPRKRSKGRGIDCTLLRVYGYDEGETRRSAAITRARAIMAERHPKLAQEPNFVERIGEAPYYGEYCRILDELA